MVQRSGWVGVVIRRTCLSLCQLKPFNRPSLESGHKDNLVHWEGKIYSTLSASTLTGHFMRHGVELHANIILTGQSCGEDDLLRFKLSIGMGIKTISVTLNEVNMDVGVRWAAVLGVS